LLIAARQDPEKKQHLRQVWGMIHAETAALWVMATITTKIKSTTVKGYTGTLTNFG